MSHTHSCVICGDAVPCAGYAVGSEHESDRHCVRLEDSAPVLCEGCQDARQCDWCGAWYPPADGRVRYPGLCSRQCGDEQDEAHPLVPTEAAVLRRGAGL